MQKLTADYWTELGTPVEELGEELKEVKEIATPSEEQLTGPSEFPQTNTNQRVYMGQSMASNIHVAEEYLILAVGGVALAPVDGSEKEDGRLVNESGCVGGGTAAKKQKGRVWWGSSIGGWEGGKYLKC